MDLPPFHRRVLDAVLPLCDKYGLLLAGGYAMRAHGLVDRPSQDLDFATANALPLPEIADALVTAFRTLDFETETIEATPRMARLMVSDAATRQSCELDLLKEALQRPPVLLDLIPVVGLDDAVGMKVRALHGRSVPRDLIDVAALAQQYGFRDLERLGAIHDEDFSIHELAMRLQATELLADELFEAYGLDAAAIAQVRRFAFEWLEDIKQRRVEDGDIELWLDPDTYPN